MGKWGVWATRTADSVCGAAERWCTRDDNHIVFDIEDLAISLASHYNENCVSPNVSYAAKEYNDQG
jgi:hypothetical protein